MKQLNIWIFIITLTALNVTMGLGASRVDDPTYLKGYWKLNGTTKDYSGNGNDLVCVSTTNTSVRIQGSYKENTYGNLSMSSELTLLNCLRTATVNTVQKDLDAGVFSVSMWVDSSSISYAKNNKYDLFSIWGPSPNYQYIVRLFASSKIEAYHYTAGKSVVLDFASATTNFSAHPGFFHISYVYNFNTAQIYMNGSLVASTNIVNTSLWQANGVAPLYFNNNIDDGEFSYNFRQWNIRVYNCALTQAEVTEIYNKEQVSRSIPNVSTNEPNLVFHTVNGVTDLSPSLNTITRYGLQAVGNGIEVGGVTNDVRGITITNSYGYVSNTTNNSMTVLVDMYLPNGYIESLSPNGPLGNRSALFEINGSFLACWLWGAEFRLYNTNAYTQAVTIPHTLLSNNRYRFVTTISPGGLITLYINGVFKGNSTISGNQAFYTGYNTTFFTKASLNGNTASIVAKEIKIYNIAQPASWVQQDYDNAVGNW